MVQRVVFPLRHSRWHQRYMLSIYVTLPHYGTGYTTQQTITRGLHTACDYSGKRCATLPQHTRTCHRRLISRLYSSNDPMKMAPPTLIHSTRGLMPANSPATPPSAYTCCSACLMPV